MPNWSRVDSSLGFNWLDLLISTNSSPLFGAVLKAAYHSSATQIVGVCLLLAAANRGQRLTEFLTLFVVTFVAVAAISALVPAAGPYAYFQPPKELFSSFSPDAGMWHYQVLQALRNEPVPVLSFMNVQGLVTFPSFHTSLAIITAYAVRGIKFVATPVAILNGIVIISTLPEGGHYLIDVIAGAVISTIAIVAVRTRYLAYSVVGRPTKRFVCISKHKEKILAWFPHRLSSSERSRAALSLRLPCASTEKANAQPQSPKLQARRKDP